MKEENKKNIEIAFSEKIKSLEDLSISGELSKKDFIYQKKYAEFVKMYTIHNYDMSSKFINPELSGWKQDKLIYNTNFDFVEKFYPAFLEEHFKNNK